MHAPATKLNAAQVCRPLQAGNAGHRYHSGGLASHGDEVVPVDRGSSGPCAPISRPLPEIVKAVRFDKTAPNMSNVPMGRQHTTTYFNKTTPKQPRLDITPLPMHVLQSRIQNKHTYRNDATWEPVRVHRGNTRTTKNSQGRVAWVEACWW